MKKLNEAAVDNVFLDPLDDEAEIERKQAMKNLEMMLAGKSSREIRGEQLRNDDRHFRGEETDAEYRINAQGY